METESTMCESVCASVFRSVSDRESEGLGTCCYHYIIHGWNLN